jgi:hypothetical protein
MELSDDARAQALKAAQKVELAGDTKSLPTAELGTGEASSPTTTGTIPPGYGKDLNRVPEQPTQQPEKG